MDIPFSVLKLNRPRAQIAGARSLLKTSANKRTLIVHEHSFRTGAAQVLLVGTVTYTD